jgi:hypothetical protein
MDSLYTPDDPQHDTNIDAISITQDSFLKYHFLRIVSERKITTVLEMEVGGGVWSYYYGICKYLQETFDLDDVMYVGHSAGIEPTYWLAMEIDIQWVWDQYKEFLHEIDAKSTKALWNWTTLALKHRKRMLGVLERDGYDMKNLLEKLNRRLIVGSSQISSYYLFPYLQKTYTTGFSSHDSALKCLTASYTIPFITAPFFVPYESLCLRDMDDKKVCRSKHIDSYLSHDGDAMEKGGQVLKHFEGNARFFYIHNLMWRPFTVQQKWLWTDDKTNDDLFNLGYEDAKKNHKSLSGAFFEKKKSGKK